MRVRGVARLFVILALLSGFSDLAWSQKLESPKTPGAEDVDTAAGISRSNQSVQVPHTTGDREIAARLQRIYKATDWFTDLAVESREGIVTIKGTVAQKSQREWAENLARDTEGVVAVINSIEVPAGAWFDIRPAEQETRTLAKKFLSFTPYFAASIVVLLFTLGGAFLSSRLGRKTAKRKFTNPLMIEFISKLFALPVVLLGIYLVLNISGLTGVAVTIVGGTGAVGLVAGFAMKNILENYFTGVMLSMSNPYTPGDSIIVNGKKGIVQTLTTRGTVLIDYDGNQIIIPNSTIYATTVINETANPSSRIHFTVGVDYSVAPAQVRELVLAAINEAKDVLNKPEPLVMMTRFDASSIAYEIYFWVDSRKSSGMKMQSMVMELVLLRLREAGIRMPADVKELVFLNSIEQAAAERPSSTSQPTEQAMATVKNSQTELETHGLLNEASKGRDITHGEKLL